MKRDAKRISKLDKLIHEPARLSIVAVLTGCERADFTYLLNATGLTRGNLSRHLSKLEEAGYIKAKKVFIGKIPNSSYSLTKTGKKSFRAYRKMMRDITK